MQTVKLATIRLQQPIGDFFVATIPADVLRGLASADMRRISSREIEEYTGIQRGLSQTRLKEIGSYIETVDASFPNSIILNLRSANIVKQDTLDAVDCNADGRIVCFEIKMGEETFQIIDGQHRLAGFTDNNSAGFDLIVAFFIDLPVEEQAYLFSTINLTQTKVSKSLVYDLFDLSQTRSPQKTAHLVAKAMNSDPDSPLYHRLKLLGLLPKIEGQVLYAAPLTQGTFVGRLLGLISRDPIADRDAEKRGKRPEITGDEIPSGLIFRQFYLEEKDWAILKVLKNYFSAIANTFRDEWQDRDNPLSKTIGYGALMRLLIPLYQEGTKGRDVSQEYFEERLRVAYHSYRTSGVAINFKIFPAAGSGETRLFEQLRSWLEPGKDIFPPASA